jgi:sugar-specific transcriptional regulator TrmB
MERLKGMEDTVKAFSELGLTELEARILVALQKHNRTTAKDISVTLDVHRQQIYNALTDLQKKGLVTEQLGRPSQFKTAPLNQLFGILLERKSNWLSNMEKKTAEISKTFKESLPEYNVKAEYTFDLITGTERVKSALHKWGKPSRTIDTTVKFDPLMLRIAEALDTRRIEYRKDLELRIVTDNTKYYSTFRQNFPKREVRVLKYPVPLELVIYDRKRAHLAVYPNRCVSASSEVAVLTSNHPCFVEMLQNCFDILWRASKEKPNLILDK